MGLSFNPFRVTTDRIIVSPPPSDSALDGSGFAVQPVKFGFSNIYFIKTSRGYLLVDTGMPNSDEQFEVVFKKSTIDPKRVHLIILTHGHLDHIGNLAYAKKISGARVLVHQSYADLLEWGEIEPAIAQNFTGRFQNFFTGLVGAKLEGVKSDIVVAEEFDLHEYGLEGKVIHTPGHSPGSISIILDNGEALIGDMVREEKPGELDFGNFYEDQMALLESLRRVATLEPKVIYLSHGSYIDNFTLRSFIERVVMEYGA